MTGTRSSRRQHREKKASAAAVTTNATTSEPDPASTKASSPKGLVRKSKDNESSRIIEKSDSSASSLAEKQELSLEKERIRGTRQSKGTASKAVDDVDEDGDDDSERNENDLKTKASRLYLEADKQKEETNIKAAAPTAETRRPRRHTEPVILAQKQSHQQRQEVNTEGFNATNAAASSKAISSSSSSWSKLPIVKVLDESFLRRNSSKKDLFKRFRHLLWVLETHCQEQDENDEDALLPREQWPGLGGLAWYVVQTFLRDTDSTVRLWASAVCLELLAVFAPDIPWDTPELKLVWNEVLHQIATLTSSLTSAAGDSKSNAQTTNQPNQKFLTRMLQLIAHVQMGALLKELVDEEVEEAFNKNDNNESVQESTLSSASKNGKDTDQHKTNLERNRIVSSSPSSSTSDDDGDLRKSLIDSSIPLKPIATVDETDVTAKELLAQFVSTMLQAIRASASLQEYIVQAISAIIQEYGGDPKEYGGTNKILVPVAVLDELLLALLPGPTLKVPKYSTTKRGEPPVWHTVDNPVYRVSAQVLVINASILQHPLSALLHQLLAKSFHGGAGGEQQDVLLESVIATEPPMSSINNADPTQDASVYSIVPLVYQISASSSSPTTASSHHSLLETRVFGMLQEGLIHLQEDTRKATCRAVAECLTGSSLRHIDSLLLTPWLSRHKDSVPDIRKLVARHIPMLLLHQQQQFCNEPSTPVLDRLVEVAETLLTDPQKSVRVTAFHSICNEYLYPNAAESHHETKSHEQHTVNRLIRILLDLDLPQAEMRDIFAGLVRVWVRAAWGALGAVLFSSDDDGEKESSKQSSLFASLLLNKLEPERSSSPKKRPSADPSETCYTDWLIYRLFQMATSYQNQHHQYRASSDHRTHRTGSFAKQHQATAIISVLESALQQGWEKYVVETKKNANNKRSDASQQMSIAAAMVLWHRIPHQVGVSWGQPRARRQQTLLEYLEARRESQEAPKGTELALTADAKALELLRRLYWLMAHGQDDNVASDDDQINEVLLAFHRCRDKQVFRILSTIANSSHSSKARQRALDQVPSRIKAFLNDEATAAFSFKLVEQTAFPDFMNFSVLRDITQIAEQHGQLRLPALKIVHMMTRPFPRMAETAWGPLSNILRSTTGRNKKYKVSDEDNITCVKNEIGDVLLNLITAILGTSAAFAPETSTFPPCILELCRHGSPEQARNSIKAIVAFNGREKKSQVNDDDMADALSLIDSLPPELSFTNLSQTLTILASITALVEADPGNGELMESAGHDTWRFCLKAIHKDFEQHSTSPRRKRNRSPTRREAGLHLVICAAIEFLVSFLRAFLFVSSTDDRKSIVTTRQKDIQKIFNRLVTLSCSSEVPEGIRECSSIHFCRLCDPRIRLEPIFISNDLWCSFCSAFLEDSPVREVLGREFSLFLTGGGVYGDEASPRTAEAPSLRIASLHMFLQTKQIKVAATHSITILRDTCDKAYSQCRALGKKAEEKFESTHKMRLMPEYMVPFALYLLSFYTDQGDERTLRRRLKLLLEPLVQSLGDTADNISFLLRMAEYLGGNFKPIVPNSQFHEVSCNISDICQATREVLLSMVKKDVNLSPYTGQIHVPARLFRRTSASKQLSQSSLEFGADSFLHNASPLGVQKVAPRLSSMKKQHSTGRSDKSAGLRVQFSPDSDMPRREIKPPPTNTDEEKSSFGGLSPIAKSSPEEWTLQTKSQQCTPQIAASQSSATTTSADVPAQNSSQPTKSADNSDPKLKGSEAITRPSANSSIQIDSSDDRPRISRKRSRSPFAKPSGPTKKVPIKIRVERKNPKPKATRSPTCEASNLEFESEDDAENVPNASTRGKRRAIS
ncbi:hypothetical protein ACA910_003170 [Epithemia clementina (nom. ined.)]